MTRLPAARLLPLALAGVLLAAACTSGGSPRQQQGRPDGRLIQVGLPPALPDTTGWGVHVLGLARGADGTLWAGTFGSGIWMQHRDSSTWRNIRAGEGSIAWDYVNSVIPQDAETIWYGTIGNGFGVSTDGGQTWRNWTYDELGPEWQYVALEGIRTLGDTVLIATADGLRMTWDGGTTWRCVIARAGAPGAVGREDRGCTERIAGLPNEYILSLDVGYEGEIRVGTLSGMALSRDGGATWTTLGSAQGVPQTRIRGVATSGDSSVWFVDEAKVYVDSLEDGEFAEAEVHLPGLAGLPGPPRGVTGSPPGMLPTIPTPFGLVAAGDVNRFRVYYLAAAERYRPAGDVWAVTWWGPPFWPLGATTVGIARVLAGESPVPALTEALPGNPPAAPRRPWLRRPMCSGRAVPITQPLALESTSFALLSWPTQRNFVRRGCAARSRMPTRIRTSTRRTATARRWAATSSSTRASSSTTRRARPCTQLRTAASCSPARASRAQTWSRSCTTRAMASAACSPSTTTTPSCAWASARRSRRAT